MKRKHNFWRRTDVRIRRCCRKLTPRQRMASVMTASVLFMAGCLYMIITALSGFGKPEGGLEIEYIRSPGHMLDNDRNNGNIHFNDIQDYGHPENKDTVRLFG